MPRASSCGEAAGSDSASEPAYHGETGAGEARRQALGLREAVSRGVSRADNGDGHFVLRVRLTAAKEHAGRVVNLPQRPWVIGVGLGQHVDAVLSGGAELGLGVDLVVGRHEAGGNLRPDAFDGLELVAAGGEHRGR